MAPSIIITITTIIPIITTIIIITLPLREKP